MTFHVLQLVSTCFRVTGIWFVSVVEQFLAFWGDFWAKNSHFQAKNRAKTGILFPKKTCFLEIDSKMSTSWNIRYFLFIVASRDIWSDTFSFLIHHKTQVRWFLGQFTHIWQQNRAKSTKFDLQKFLKSKNDQKNNFLKIFQSY